MSGGHSGEAIPVPIPNTEVKLSNADDTAFRGGKVGSCQTFFCLNNFLLCKFTFSEDAFLCWEGGCLRRLDESRRAWFKGES